MNKQAIINDFVRAAFEAGGVENLNIKQVVLNLSYRYNEGVKTVNAIVQEAIKARRNNPGLKYSLDENGFILMERGGKFVQIESCRDFIGREEPSPPALEEDRTAMPTVFPAQPPRRFQHPRSVRRPRPLLRP
jgi:hypothetical protein